MKLSLFTPTHDTKFLLETWHSLQFQDYANYEWVISPNSGAVVPETIRNDPRVVITEQCPSSNIGALKRFACDNASGDVFVELDHDDLLAPGILTKIAQAAAAGAGFIYSDCALFSVDKNQEYNFTAYAGTHAWQPYETQIYERTVLVSKAFPVSARTLCEIYYAPDHVRCWSRRAYYLSGGHNAELSVGDDHQLMIKTYLSGVKFHHIEQLGYLYRVHDGNTVKHRNAKIQEVVATNRMEYLGPLMCEWSRRSDLPVVDLGELFALKQWKLGDALPFKENSVGVLRINEGLQFLAPEQQVPFFNQAYDALAPGGWLTGQVPSMSGRYGVQDPRHRTFFNINSMRFYCEREFAKNNADIRCRFQLVQNMECYTSTWDRDQDMKIVQFDMCALKGQRQPGAKKI